MTYCVAVSVNEGLVFCSDSRTSAGVDQISTYSKMHFFGTPGQRQLVLLTSGNLATSQAVLAQLSREIRDGTERNLLNLPTISDIANHIGEISIFHRNKFKTDNNSFDVSFILGGQILGSKPRIVRIYPEGNSITSSKDTPYLQIGESKYGKPILDRILSRETKLDTAALCSLVSMDSTMRSNLTVGPPIELTIYRTDSFAPGVKQRFVDDSEYLRQLNRSWDRLLKDAFKQLPPLAWADNWDGTSSATEPDVSHGAQTESF